MYDKNAAVLYLCVLYTTQTIHGSPFVAEYKWPVRYALKCCYGRNTVVNIFYNEKSVCSI